MTNSSQQKRVNGSKKQPNRGEKLSAQLRANLKRRKQQIKSRKQSADEIAPSGEVDITGQETQK